MVKEYLDNWDVADKIIAWQPAVSTAHRPTRESTTGAVHSSSKPPPSAASMACLQAPYSRTD